MKHKLKGWQSVKYTDLAKNSTAFTLIEVMVVLSIMSFMTSIVLTGFVNVRESAYEARLASEFKTMRNAIGQYLTEFDEYPADVSRNIPPGIEPYLVAAGNDADGWPDGPWPGSVYDYDAYVVGGEEVYQISLRFCNIGGTQCNFPKTEWAEGFGTDSSAYYCLQGACKAHPARPDNYPGYCVNCVD